MADWRTLKAEASTRITRLFLWWGRELASCLPTRFRSLIVPGRTKLLIEIHKMGTLKLTKLSPAGREPLMTVQPRGDRAQPGADNSLTELTEDVDSVVISLPESCGVRQRVELPTAASENLREVLAMEMDRLTPFKAQDIYFAHDSPVPGKSKDQICVDLTIVPKALADDVMRMARNLGIEPDVLSLGDDDKFDRNLLGSMPSPARSFPPLLAKAFGAAVLFLLIAAAAVPFGKQAQAITSLEGRIADARAAGNEAVSVQQQLIAWHEGTKRVSTFRSANPSAIAVLNDLSNTIPKGTWLTDIELSLEPSRLVMSGFSDNAAALIAPLEALPTLQGVKFEEPVSFDDRQSRDRFRLSASIVVASSEARP